MSVANIQQPIVTAVQFGGNWYGAVINPDYTVEFISLPASVKKVAEFGAQSFAYENGLVYKENEFHYKKPIISIRHKLGCWAPVKIFQDRIEQAGTARIMKEEAKKDAENLAKEQGLEYFPEIGENIFPNEY